MIYSIDFEATQFSNRIISIGCVAENGNTFYTLVKPVNKEKINKFITELTGITQTDLNSAISTDEGFNNLANFINENNDDKGIEIYCYGNGDINFLNHTIKYMHNAQAIVVAMGIKELLIDYSQEVIKYFKLKECIKLITAYNFIEGTAEKQKHSSLRDAEMLMSILKHMKSNRQPEDGLKLAALRPKRVTKPADPKKQTSLELQHFYESLNGYKKFGDTRFDEREDWLVCCEEAGSRRYFSSYEEATMWAIYYVINHKSYKCLKDFNSVKNNINNAIINKTPYGKLYWNERK